MRIDLKIWGALVIACVVLVTSMPLLSVGFFGEDHYILGIAARLPLPEFVARYFDFSQAASFYRPVQGLLEWFQYHWFGNEPAAYRAVELLTHLANCLLLYGLVTHVSQKWQIGLLTALIFSGLPAMKSSFYWITGGERSVAFFYLLTLIFWLKYLEQNRRRYLVLSAVGFILATMTKEYGATLIVALFLVDRWIVARPVPAGRLVRRYLPFALVLLLFAASYVPRLSVFTSGQYGGPYAGMGLGLFNLTNLIYYAATLAYPWNENWPVNLIWLVLVLLFLFYFVFVKHNRQLALLSLLALLPVLPVLPFTFAAERYLYLSMMVPAILFTLALDRVRSIWIKSRWFSIATLFFLMVLVLSDASATAEAFNGMSTFTRQYRAPIRPIFQQHAAFGPDAFLYFVDSPLITDILSGMLALRYGPNVTVGGTDEARSAALHRHVVEYVYTFDQEGSAVEHPVEPVTKIETEPALPVGFNVPIRLDGLDVTGQNVKRGQALVLLLYWRSIGRVDKDYTLFAHLVDSEGNMVAGSDGQPRGGKSPTSTWQPNRLVVDWVVLPIGDDVPAGDKYRVEIGWYYLPTMERFSVVDANGQAITDHLTVQPFSISD